MLYYFEKWVEPIGRPTRGGEPFDPAELLAPSQSLPDRPAVATNFSGNLATRALGRCESEAATPQLRHARGAMQPGAEFHTWRGLFCSILQRRRPWPPLFPSISLLGCYLD